MRKFLPTKVRKAYPTTKAYPSLCSTVTKSRLNVECISDDMDDDLGICSEDLEDDMDTGVIS